MTKQEFGLIRTKLGKTQKELAPILCVSTKSVQGFEQGWRRIPPYVERQMLVLLSLKLGGLRNGRSCWEIQKCPKEWRAKCVIWDLRARHFCWFLNGTFCRGQTHRSWKTKMDRCRKCEVYQAGFAANLS